MATEYPGGVLMKAAGLFGPQAVSPWSQGAAPSVPKGPGVPNAEKALPGLSPGGEALLKGRPHLRKLLAENPQDLAYFARNAQGNNPRNALKVLELLLQTYGNNVISKAKDTAEANKTRSENIARASRFWNQAKIQIQKHTDFDKPNNKRGKIVDGKEFLTKALGPVNALRAMDEPDSYKEWALDDLKKFLFPGHQNGFVSYDDVTAADAVMNNFCGSHQVYADEGTQVFKDKMTLLGAAREENKDLRQQALTFSRRSG
ncbi:MAG: hypothetical protein OXC07_00440 [Kistimonas sp.]|nr:hypothetical protein [Kistimonas sp.]